MTLTSHDAGCGAQSTPWLGYREAEGLTLAESDAKPERQEYAPGCAGPIPVARARWPARTEGNDHALRSSQPGVQLAILLGTPTAVPLDLIGMTNCVLHVDVFAQVGFRGSAIDLADWTLVNDPGLVGFVLSTQVALLELGANPFGLTLSRAYDVYIGDW